MYLSGILCLSHAGLIFMQTVPRYLLVINAFSAGLKISFIGLILFYFKSLTVDQMTSLFSTFRLPVSNLHINREWQKKFVFTFNDLVGQSR